MKVDFTNEMVYSLEGPNLCLLGNKEDFIKLSKIILELTYEKIEKKINITELDFTQIVGQDCTVYFSSKKGAKELAVVQENNNVILELDCFFWNRIFQFSALLSWERTTYYLNYYETGLKEFDLRQNCNLVWSSEF